MKKHELAPLPYEKSSLAPHMSVETLDFHYGKHHQTYIDNLNKLIDGTDFAEKSLEDIIKSAPSGAIFNNAAQVFNHTFFWHSLSPSSPITSEAAEILSKHFGSVEAFKEQFTKQAMSVFGSGWTWLVKSSDGNLEIINTANAGTPITDGKKPLVVVDIWEHAYYIDYRNARAKFLENIWNIINWKFLVQNYQ